MTPNSQSPYRYGNFRIDKIIAVLDPDADIEFEQRKKKLGSFYAFHGTKSDCVYSIFRNSLRDLSNSHLMTAGAALGAGIYSATTLGTAAGYSAMSQRHDNSLPSQRYIAVIEIINEKSYDKGNTVYVVTRENDIRIRFYLVEHTHSSYS